MKIFQRNEKTEDDVFAELSLDTRIVLRQYMNPIWHHGKKMYAVSDVRLFDLFLRNHPFQHCDYNGTDKLAEYIRNELDEKRAFFLFINGEEYVAITPIKRVEADDLVN